jgi:hypothetical protein
MDGGRIKKIQKNQEQKKKYFHRAFIKVKIQEKIFFSKEYQKRRKV